MVQKIRPERERLDRVLVNRGLVASREDAVRLILAGLVRVDGAVVDKAAKLTLPDASVEVTGPGSPYVGRGGEKLAGALDQFQVDPKGMTCFDVGCSTGGFTDCLLQRGASRVYAVDVGYGQFEWRLRQDPRVVLMERTNIRHPPPHAIPEPIDLIVIDVSFISLTLVLPCVVSYLTASGSIITLIKPQFEVGKGLVGRGGIVRDDRLREGAAEKVIACASSLGLELAGRMESHIEGRKGNREILAWFRHKASSEQDMRRRDVTGADENTLRKSTEGVG